MVRLIIPTDVGMTRPIIPTNHVGAMARRTKGRPIVPTNHIVGKTGIPFFRRPNHSNCRNSRTVGQMGCRTKGRAIISTKKFVGKMGVPLFRRSNVPTNGQIVGIATRRSKKTSK